MWSDKLRERNADAYLIESNHDLEMLRMGPYAWHLKQRNLATRHLSNDDARCGCVKMMGDRTKRIYLGLSQDNNMKEIAYQTAEHLPNARQRRSSGVRALSYGSV